MVSRIQLDPDLAFVRAQVRGAGVDRRALRALQPRLSAVHAQLEAAADEDLLPHRGLVRHPERLAPALQATRGWKADRVVVLGEPGAVGAATLLACQGGLRPVVGVDGPDPALLRAALAGAEAPALVVLDGPAWVRRVATAMAPRFESIAVFVGDGTAGDGWALGGQAPIEVPGAADARFGVVGAASLGLAAWAGHDPDCIVAEISSMATRCDSRGVFDNPAFGLAAVALELSGPHGDALPIVMLPTSRLSAFGLHLARAWTAFSARAVEQGNVRRLVGATPVVFTAGDEAMAQRAVEGPPEAWLLALWVDDPGGDDAAAWEVVRTLTEAHVKQSVRARRPVVGLRLSDLEPGTVAAASYLVVHAGLTLAALRGLDPLAMPAADALRDLQEDGFADNGL